MIKKSSPIVFYLILIFSLMSYVLLGYFTERTNFTQLITLFGLLFGGYFYLANVNLNENFIKQGILFSVLFRLSLLFMLPNLSDDYFRFVWDGRLSAHGINPFVVMPATFINSDSAISAGLGHELFSSMNSPGYYTIYPPVLQFIFWLSAQLFPSNILGSVIIMRVFIIAAEIGSIFLLSGILKKLELPPKNILLYALNPLVIIELTGNIHFESLMIFFLLFSVYLLLNDRFVFSAIVFSLAICSKLLPLMFLPLLPKLIGLRKSLMFYSICGITSILLFIPFLDQQFIGNIFSSINLYFQKFEFNASVYYLIRWLGYEMTGYNIIEKAGIILSIITMLSILSTSFFQKKNNFVSLFEGILFCITIYFVFATIVHPWYISTLVALSALTSLRYPLIWSGLIVMTYFTYRSIPYSENLILVFIEYVALCSFFMYEWYKRKSNQSLNFI